MRLVAAVVRTSRSIHRAYDTKQLTSGFWYSGNARFKSNHIISAVVKALVLS